jgi:hypothetical protein
MTMIRKTKGRRRTRNGLADVSHGGSPTAGSCYPRGVPVKPEQMPPNDNFAVLAHRLDRLLAAIALGS